MLKNKYLISFLLLPFFVFLYSVLSTPQVAAQSYNGTTYLMNDSEFQATGTMTASSIQSFLVSEGSGLASFSAVENCSSTIVPADDSAGYSCGVSEPASQIIFDAAQNYGINPEVILATLQKEQSLITTPNPTASQLNYAMGYGCPDSGSCYDPGFFAQVDNGTWQFRYDMDAINGQSYQGYTASQYPCQGPSNHQWTSGYYYNYPLITGNNVTFWDSYGNAYTTFVMPDASTATLYCYTPHVYPGSSAQYYSGSYWFDYYFNLWFTPFQASYYSQSSYPTLIQGQSNSAFIEYQNDGNAPWYDDVSAPQYNTYPVHLATSNPVNSSSPFANSTWPANDRPSGTFAAVYNSDGTTLASNQHVTQPGQIVKFEFTFTAPSSLSAGNYTQYVQPVLEGSTMWNMGGEAWWSITVQPVTFQASFAGQSNYPTIVQGQSAPAYIRYQNTGNEPWYDNVSAPQYNTYPVHLATSNPVNYSSPFSASWPTNDRAAGTFAHVYLSDGTTLAPDQHVAQPGQIVEFDFTFSAPSSLYPGYYQEYFQPVLEGSAMWNMGGEAWLGVQVNPVTFQASYYAESSSPSISPGQSAPVYFKFQNTGNEPWYDDVSAPQYNTYPVHLATSNPINSSSPFANSTWPANDRPSGTFAAVYNSDGTTLASNQHVAQPGQIVEYSFTVTAPSNMSSGYYQEYFQPILEGSTMWNMGGEVWTGITVN